MRTLIYMRDGLVYLPTVERHEDGGTCRLVELGPPLPLTDPASLRQALDRHLATEARIVDRETWRRSMRFPPCPPDGSGRPIRSWPKFYRSAWSWDVVETDACRVWTSLPSVLRGKVPPPREPLLLAGTGTISDQLIALMEQAALAEQLAPFSIVPARGPIFTMLHRGARRLRRWLRPDPLRLTRAEKSAGQTTPPDDALEDQDWISLPPGRRIDPQADMFEWLVNSAPEDAPDIRDEIERLYYRHGDKEGGDALSQALTEVQGATDAEQRRSILSRYEFYTRASRLEG